MKLSLRLLVLTMLSIILLVACGTEDEVDGNNTEEQQTPLEVYTTLYPLEYFANEIGGELVDVTSILPAGADAHTYEPTSRMMVDIAESDLFIYTSDDFEVYASRIREAIGDESVTIIEATEGLDMMDYSHDHSHGHDHEDEDHHHDHDHDHEDEDHHHDHDHDHEDEDHHHDHDHDHEDEDHHHDHDHDHEDEDHHHDHDHDHEDEDHHHDHDHDHEDEDHDDDDHGHSHGDYDPHVWISPTLSIDLAENIKEALVELMPEQAEVFEENYVDLVERLEELDSKFHSMVEQFENRSILVTHAAYGYWERDYEIEQIAITGLSPSDEPSQQQLVNIMETVAELDIQYLLFEQNVEPRVATVIQEEAGLESLQLHNLEVLTEEDIEAGEDYFSLMERNISVLETALAE
ncbi:zinc transport system substrate-binding protein [Natronobacillus azotifigens]|uniref:metal ABC transporter solute-binding protein, Zn/Mn family n=1 Tax=Natronobacillus azotifigens TaxID=472978 RepID=UPI003D20939E